MVKRRKKGAQRWEKRWKEEDGGSDGKHEGHQKTRLDEGKKKRWKRNSGEQRKLQDIFSAGIPVWMESKLTRLQEAGEQEEPRAVMEAAPLERRARNSRGGDRSRRRRGAGYWRDRSAGPPIKMIWLSRNWGEGLFRECSWSLERGWKSRLGKKAAAKQKDPDSNIDAGTNKLLGSAKLEWQNGTPQNNSPAIPVPFKDAKAENLFAVLSKQAVWLADDWGGWLAAVLLCSFAIQMKSQPFIHSGGSNSKARNLEKTKRQFVKGFK